MHHPPTCVSTNFNEMDVNLLESKLNLDFDMVAKARTSAAAVADQVQDFIEGYTTVAVERTVCRLMGIDGVEGGEVPLPNLVVDHLVEHKGLAQGVAFWVGNAMAQLGEEPQAVAEKIAKGELVLTDGEPLIEVDPQRIDESLGIDASKSVYRNGSWQSPDGS